MKLPKNRYGDLIDTLDGIRADNREWRYGEDCRKIDDEMLLYIERKGYCKYEINTLRFIRVLTDNGMQILGSQSYAKYRRNKIWAKWGKRAPLIVSTIAVLFTGLSYWQNTKNQKTDVEKRIERLEKVQDSMYLQNHLLIPKSIPNIDKCILQDSLTKDK